MTMVLRSFEGDLMAFVPSRWHAEPDPFETRLLVNLAGPVLDVGCGPGRVVAALGRRGVPALGVDPAPSAVDLARRRGANVLQRSVFDPLPGEGRWVTVVLLDGNVGIGGDAVRLLRRCRELVAPAGTVVVELEPPGSWSLTRRVRIEDDADRGPWFSWTVVGTDAIAAVAGAAGLRPRRLEQVGKRWFAHLERADVRP
jgi:SAM-dependent methyltransferase